MSWSGDVEGWSEGIEGPSWEMAKISCPNCGADMVTIKDFPIEGRQCSGCGQTMVFRQELTITQFQALLESGILPVPVPGMVGESVASYGKHQTARQDVRPEKSQDEVLIGTLFHSAFCPSLN